jgi:acyl carrier protein
VSEDAIRDALAKILGRIAPEADLDSVDPKAPLQRALDIDSFDFLNLLVGVRDDLGVAIAESDYRQIMTLEGLTRLIASRRGGG